MADNYLERRMEEHRRSQQGATVKHVRPTLSALKPGQTAVDYPPIRVLVTDGTSETGIAVIEIFRRFGCRVAFTANDSMTANKIAQRFGAQYHPGTVEAAKEYLAQAGDPASAIIDTDGLMIAGAVPIHTQARKAGSEAVAAWVIFATHPANKWILEII